MKVNTRRPSHPGKVFKRNVLDRLEITPLAASKHLGISKTKMYRFVNEEERCTVELACRIADATGSNVQVWLNLQNKLDIWEAENYKANLNVTPFPK